MSYDLNTATCFTELKSLDTSENVKKYSSTELTKLSQGTDEYYKRQRRFVKLFLDLLIKIHDMDNVVPISTVPSEEIVFNYQNPNEILEPDHRYIKKRVYPKEEEGLPQTKGNDVYYDLTQFHSIKPDHILYPYLLYDYLLIVGDKNTHASLTYNRNTIQDALLYHYQLCKEHDQDLKLLMETTYGNNIILVEDAIPLAINNKKLIEGCLDNYQNNFVYISPKKSVKSMTAAQQIIIFKLYLEKIGVDINSVDLTEHARFLHLITGTKFTNIQNSNFYKRLQDRVPTQSADLHTVRKLLQNAGFQSWIKTIDSWIEDRMK